MPPLPVLFGGLAAARGIVLAVSGGPDSTALMHLAAAWRPAGMPMRVATLDHGLRPEARRDAEAVAHMASDLGLSSTILTWEGPKPDRGVQEHARAARYGLLFGLTRAVGASHLVTAHTLDDQAETLLMRLAAGSGPAGLAGMRPTTTRGDLELARPFLAIRKHALVALCREHGWPFVDDPANGDTRFARARWRRLAPALIAEGLTAERLGQLAARLARTEIALQFAADRVARDHRCETAANTYGFTAGLLDQPDELVLRVLDTTLGIVGADGPARLGKLERLLEAIRQAQCENRPLRRTLRGCLVTLDASGRLSICAEPPRLGTAHGASEPQAGAPNISISLNANR